MFFVGCGVPRAVVGTSVVITMGINIVSPHLQFVFQALRSLCRRSKESFRYFVTQQQADAVSGAVC